ncbi:MAG: hydroxymethylbilane synthase [Gemmataceae bacterium]|nr:hydroxymethylbilane synthase [Gemmataceae bacterium]
MMTAPLRIGTRGSPLALWQANHIADALKPLAAPRPIELVRIQTTGDQVRDQPLSQLGGIGVFTKEIQRALLTGEVDVAVHSLKDLPTIPVEGLALAAVPPRGPTADAFLSRRHRSFDELPLQATVATGSLRRRAQILHRRPDLQLIGIRGNVDTRLRKLADEDLDAIILAEAGLQRLGLGSNITQLLDATWMLPAVGQGALGLECRNDDTATRVLLAQLNHEPTKQAVLAERAMLFALGGGCLVPIGALGTVVGDVLTLRGAVLPPSGKQCVEGELSGPAGDAERLGQRLAQELLARGAGELLAPSMGE